MNFRKYDYYLPTLGQSWILVLLLVAGSLLFGFVISFLAELSGLNLLRWTSLSYLLSMLLPFFYIWSQSNKCFIEREFIGAEPVKVNNPLKGGAHAVLYFILIGVAMLALGIIIEPATSIIPMPDNVKATFEALFNNPNTFDLVLATCILAPLCEEMLCRGVIMRGLVRHNGPRKAIIWSALIFAVIHMNPWQGIPAFIIGLFFGWVYYRTGSLVSTIFLHFVNNSSSIVMTKIFPDLAVDATYADILPEGGYKYFYLCVVIIFAAIILLLNRMMPKLR